MKCFFYTGSVTNLDRHHLPPIVRSKQGRQSKTCMMKCQDTFLAEKTARPERRTALLAVELVKYETDTAARVRHGVTCWAYHQMLRLKLQFASTENTTSKVLRSLPNSLNTAEVKPNDRYQTESPINSMGASLKSML